MSSKFNINKIILGHNQFFGTDHMSSEREAERARYFSDIFLYFVLLYSFRWNSKKSSVNTVWII